MKVMRIPGLIRKRLARKVKGKVKISRAGRRSWLGLRKELYPREKRWLWQHYKKLPDFAFHGTEFKSLPKGEIRNWFGNFFVSGGRARKASFKDYLLSLKESIRVASTYAYKPEFSEKRELIIKDPPTLLLAVAKKGKPIEILEHKKPFDKFIEGKFVRTFFMARGERHVHSPMLKLTFNQSDLRLLHARWQKEKARLAGEPYWQTPAYNFVQNTVTEILLKKIIDKLRKKQLSI